MSPRDLLASQGDKSLNTSLPWNASPKTRTGFSDQLQDKIKQVAANYCCMHGLDLCQGSETFHQGRPGGQRNKKEE